MNIHILHRPLFDWQRSLKRANAVGGIALAVSIAAGSTFSSFAKLLRGVLSPLSLMFVSEALSSLFVIISYGLFPVIQRYFRLRARQAWWLFTMGLLSGVAGPMLFFSGLSYTAAVNAGLFAKSEAIFIIILASAALGERMMRAHAAAISTVITGIAIIAMRGFTESFEPHWGDTMIIASAFCYAAGSIIFRAKLDGIEPHIALFSRSSLAMATFFLSSPFLQHPFIEEIRNIPLSIIPILISFAFISRFLNSVTFYVALEHIPVTTVSLVGTLDVIGTALFALWFLGEPIQWYHIVGGLFIIMGNILLEILGIHRTPDQLEMHLKHRIP